MRAASFFSGIGGIDLGLEKSGIEIVYQCEILSFGQKVLKKHWPNIPLSQDITKLTGKDIPDAEIFAGGFPCQDLSLANQGKRKGLEGARSGLFYKYAELIGENRPRWVFIENVPGLLNSAKGADFKVVLSTLDELGYGVSWRILDAKFFGTPQRRRRTYIVASRGTIGAAEVLFEQGTNPIINKQSTRTRNFIATGNDESLPEANIFSIQHAGIGRRASAGPQGKGYRNDGETYTLDSRGSSDAICKANAPFGIRTATGLSGRLDGSRYRAIGNAVCVPVIEWIGSRIVEMDKKYYPEYYL
ncbi:DNA (cytosine-5-)-methyltransferase [Clostridiales bacterium 1_7_47FAA]|uniref:Cytosine-specific methyltransferase n=1 Tax=Enterocloster hominis (ex Hitch et al. 2024) TaxID=1917870 RepID=A0ABV1DBU1_9FIRM|nr:DNA (cytosine-5-)-methyltransferase [Clostridiales bacterium 1_7_47FAA]